MFEDVCQRLSEKGAGDESVDLVGKNLPASSHRIVQGRYPTPQRVLLSKISSQKMEKSITMNGEDDDRENFQPKLYFIESFAYFLIHISFLRVNINFTKFSSSHVILSTTL